MARKILLAAIAAFSASLLQPGWSADLKLNRSPGATYLPIHSHPKTSGGFQRVLVMPQGTSSCIGGPPLSVYNPNGERVKAVLCHREVAPGSFKRDFRAITLEPRIALQLGCSVTGSSQHEYRVVWWDRDFGYTPSDVTQAYQNLVVQTGGNSVALVNNNSKKSIYVRFQRPNGKIDSAVLQPFLEEDRAYITGTYVNVLDARFQNPFDNHPNQACSVAPETND